VVGEREGGRHRLQNHKTENQVRQIQGAKQICRCRAAAAAASQC
jgi:hypothetical protein